MGVQGLWELLAPVGRRVSVETLAGKKLAIDASIWMVQFMKAMRDERGEMVRNAHILGFFRRICKLLFLHIKPVFVFDGGTPALKRRTVIVRRRQRENAQAKIRKTAEKLLLNHLKEMRLKELANDIENQRQKNDLKGKNVVPANAEVTEKCSKANDKVTEGYDQEALDELLAASLAAEEDGSITTKASTSVGRVAFEEEDDEDEEMILPTMHGKIDPSVLASLPPSMQLELLVQMREGLMAENRQKYQKVKKAPAKFSELQIQAYLKTVAFRREIIEVQKTAAGRGVGGVQTSRIASESNREFIFSSSFTGDKEILASAGVKKNGEVERREARKEPASSDTAHCISSITQTSSATAAGENELRRDFDDGVETYIDERGFRRVSRVRAMGIRMTRDLQRNLDLMKEIEQEKMKDKTSLNLEAMISERVDGSPDKFPGNNQLPEASDEIISSDDETDMLVRSKNQKIHEQSILENRTPIEISFLEDESSCRGRDDDDLFANLVAGNSILVSSAENASSSNPSWVNASDCSWKEGIDDEKGGTLGNDPREECGPSSAQGNSDESEVDWEEGDFDVPRNASSSPSELNNVISRGCLEEEADIQEAIRRSLEDSTPKKSPMTSTENKNTKISIEMINQSTSGGFPCQVLTPEKDSIDSLNFPRENDGLQCQISSPLAGLKHPDQIGERDTLCVNNSPGRQLESSIAFRIKTDKKAALIDKPYQRNPVSSLQVLSEEVSENKSVYKEIPCTYLVPLESTELHLTADQFLDTFNEVGEVTSFTGSNGNHRVSSRVSAAVTSDLPEDMLVDGHQDKSEAVPTYHLYEVTENDDSQGESLMKGVACGAEKHLEQTRENFSIQDNMEVQIEKEGASLDEEMLLLREERRNLGEEQRKLERNAEAVSSEMFAECQELLQMFGLPYIIAPMEAEAQCAYMELSNLVDGVVTDDSDVFLFGARSVYKNIFDDRKYVETYFMKDIENELGLTREQLIRMALLLGSDYTEGVSGIGIVNAIEVVHAFPEEDGLQQFREWLESPDPTILGNFDAQTGSTSRKRGSKLSSNDVEAGSSGDKSISTDNIPKIKQIFMDKHRNVSKNWHIPSAFPSETVISAYVTPQVDKSTEPFSWGKPDLFVLRKLCWEKFGWSNQKVDELLVPVLKEYNKHETQLRLEAFYTFNERFAKIRSKRIKKALKGITGNRSSELMDDLPQEASKARKKCASPTGPLENKLQNSLDGNKGSLAENKKNTSEKSNSRQSRKRTESEPMPSEVGHSEPPIQNKGRRNTKKGSGVNVRGRGRRRGRGRGRGRRIEGPSFESSETSCSDEDDELEMQDEITERSTEVRRSKRPRKHVKYAGNDVEADGLSDSSEHQNDGNCKDGAVEQETLLGKEMFGGVAHDVIKEKVGSSPLQDAFSSDDLGMGGGGFCADEGEPEIENVPNQTRDSDLGNGNGNPSVQDEFSRDYLKMGGGFCMDEDEADNNIIESVSSPRRTDYSNELVDMGRMNDDDAAAAVTTRSLDSPNTKGKDEATNVGMPLEEADDSTQPKIATTTDGLKAMPFLKRKRRNN